MNNDTLKYATELQNVIVTTAGAVASLKKWLDATKEPKTNIAPVTSKDDTNYYLHLSECDDGSGQKVKLRRIFGNRRLMQAILKELETQLAEMEAEFAAL